MLTFLFLSVLITEILSFQQDDYIILMERAEVTRCNKRYLDATIRNFKYNRTSFGLNATLNFKQEIDNLKADVQAYKFQSNEYRRFPMTFSRDVCAVFRENEFGFSNLNNCGTGGIYCPFKKGRYTTCNWYPDYNKFPPYIPRGRYRIDIDFKYHLEDLISVEWYITIKDTQFLG